MKGMTFWPTKLAPEKQALDINGKDTITWKIYRSKIILRWWINGLREL